MAFQPLSVVSVNFNNPQYVLAGNTTVQTNRDVAFRYSQEISNLTIDFGYIIVKPVYTVQGESSLGSEAYKWFPGENSGILRVPRPRVPTNNFLVGICYYPQEVYPGRASPRSLAIVTEVD